MATAVVEKISDKLESLLNLIKGKPPKQFDMRTTIAESNPFGGVCGTVACIAGWASILFDYEMEHICYAQQFHREIGVTFGDAKYLCRPDSYHVPNRHYALIRLEEMINKYRGRGQ